jgi:hypothetical protein
MAILKAGKVHAALQSLEDVPILTDRPGSGEAIRLKSCYGGFKRKADALILKPSASQLPGFIISAR